ncbi:uncharacterized protein TNCT_721931 [Trichonephila clavata]|uniref:Uncharacterized protein n=1 Tax=Trichonephila clavata TaxID=2740835 RepID=A0A8X6G9D0_TRICU|nr:uncharacterized protein TNCT_721931 [Trichonephila clavata]
MEGKYLVESKEITGNVSAYGTVNPTFESVEVKEKYLSSSAPCPSSRNQKVFFEPWARYKTITMAVGLSLFGIWVIGIAVVAKEGKL